jgi:FMN phosphatase YigB (HAD superfamily)
VIVFDIDGTLADCSHRLHYVDDTRRKGPPSNPAKGPKNWEAFFAAIPNDEPIKGMVSVAISCAVRQDIGFVTGRPERTREATVEWLKWAGVHPLGYFPELLMRKDRDYRPDVEVKAGLIARLDNVDLIFEDRPRVVRMYRNLGYNVAQVGDGVEY